MKGLRACSIIAILMAALLPWASHADLRAHMDAGMPAERVVAEGLAAGKSIDAVLETIAQVVGSSEIHRFEASALRTLAIATDTAPTHPPLIAASRAAIAAAEAREYGPTPAGQRYLSAQPTFHPVATIELQRITSVLALSIAAPGTAPFAARTLRPRASAPLSGSERGTLEDALCSAMGTAAGCL